MGDILTSPLEGLELPRIPHKAYPELMAEQEISGLCMHLSIHLHLFRLCARPVSFPHRLDRLLRPRLPQLSRSNRSHVWADRGRYGGDHLGISLHGGKR